MSFKRAALALLFTSVLSTAALAEGQRVILVLDASGSMWGQIAGKAKIDIAKEVVGKVLSTWKPEDDLGLVVYGHREKGSCTDIETVWPPGPLDQGKYMSPIKSLSPKGKTPMTQAVRQAAEALKYTEQKSTVILVSDGVETCDADPCAVARELEKNGIGFTVHTVGFGLDDEAAVDQLKCMAAETGGISVLAQNADELESAFKQTVEAKVEEPPPEPAPAPEPAIVKDLQGHVVMAEGVELPPPWDQPVWVFHTALDGKPGEYLSTEYGKTIDVEMKSEGELVAVISTDMVKIEVPLSHAKGTPTKVDANLNAGIVNLSGMMDENTPLSADGGVWVISKADGTYVGTGYGVEPKHLLAAGEYKVKLEVGQAAVEVPFTVTAGKVVDVVVTLGAGVAKYTATYDGTQAAPDGVAVELRKPADLSGQKAHIATEFGPTKQFRAPSGDYVFVATLGIAKAEVPFTIASGKQVDVAINLNAGVLAADVDAATRIEVHSGDTKLDGSREHLHTEYSGKLNLTVNAGKYHVKFFGDGDAVIAEKDVDVGLGKRVEVTLP